MPVRWLAVLWCIAGCDRLFDLAHVPAVSDASDDADVPSDTSYTCPDDYTLVLRGYASRYRHEPAFTTWDAAQLACEADTAGAASHLIVLDNDDERLELVAQLTMRMQTGSVWIGLTDRVDEGTWQWVSTQAVSAPPLADPPWPSGQPDNDGGVQHCVRIQGASSQASTLFDDGQCSSSFGYVCECDGFAADRNKY